MRAEKYCMSCGKWRDKAAGELQKRRKTTVWRCGFCLEMQKQKAAGSRKEAA